MTFAKAVRKQDKKAMTTTENGMPMRKSSKDYVVDLFFNIGAMRTYTMGDKIRAFEKAFNENEELATRVLLWSRDIRGGAGERDTFRTIVQYLCTHNYQLAERILYRIPELGRWDDVLIYMNTPAEEKALELICDALKADSAMCAKWMPRHKPFKRQIKKMTDAGASTKEIEAKAQKVNAHNVIVSKIRNKLGLSSKEYRKLLSTLSSTVEQQMCNKDWGNINYSHVPSVASKQYRKAFNRNDQERYQEYLNALTKGSPEVKVNADAIFPHDVIKPLMSGWSNFNATSQEKQLAEAQWNALPDYMNDTKVLPMVDSSGSMGCNVGGTTTAMQVAFSLGMYISSKNKGEMKDTIMTFSNRPELIALNGDLTNQLNILRTAPWGMNTNIEAAFEKLLKFSKKNKISPEDMPEVILILSDMQFDQCTNDPSNTVMQMIKKKYNKHGYEVPKIVFWNLRATGTSPVKATKSGTALVSGFSPAILESILGNIDDYSPVNIMLNKIMEERYNF